MNQETEEIHWTTDTLSEVRVLVVEDDLTQLKLICQYLQVAGVTDIVTVTNSRDALRLLLPPTCDRHVVLTDNKRPKMTGRLLVEAICLCPALRHLKVAMISGDDDPELLTKLGQLHVPHMKDTEVGSQKLRSLLCQLLKRQ